MVGNLAVDYFFTGGSERYVIHCCKTCENLVHIATTIGKLQHLEYLKPPFLDTCEWVIRPVFSEIVTNVTGFWKITHMGANDTVNI